MHQARARQTATMMSRRPQGSLVESAEQSVSSFLFRELRRVRFSGIEQLRDCLGRLRGFRRVHYLVYGMCGLGKSTNHEYSPGRFALQCIENSARGLLDDLRLYPVRRHLLSEVLQGSRIREPIHRIECTRSQSGTLCLVGPNLDALIVFRAQIACLAINFDDET